MSKPLFHILGMAREAACYEEDYEPPLWWVVFSDVEPLPSGAVWYEKLMYFGLMRLKPGFRHCYLMREAHAFDGVVLVNPDSRRTGVLELRNPGGSEYLRAHIEAATVVPVREVLPEHMKMRGFFSCVSSVAHVLGIECDLYATPWQFYNILLKRAES